MKLFMIAAAMFFSQIAHSEETPRQLAKVEGFVVHNAASVSNFTLEEGTRSQCVFDPSGLEVTRCELEGASLSFKNAAGVVISMPISHLTHYQTTLSNRFFNHHIYRLTWSISQNGTTVSAPAVLTVLIEGEGAPSAVSGYLRVDEFDLSEQISGQIRN